MTGSKILVDDRKSSVGLVASPEQGWAALWWVGVLLTVVSLADIALAFYPARFGVMEWEFGTGASTIASLPLVAIGLAALLGSALARGRRGRVIGVVILLFVLAFATLGMLTIFMLDLPIALKSVTSPDIHLGIEKAVVKTVLLGVAFPIGFLAAASAALKQLRAGRRRVSA